MPGMEGTRGEEMLCLFVLEAGLITEEAFEYGSPLPAVSLAFLGLWHARQSYKDFPPTTARPRMVGLEGQKS